MRHCVMIFPNGKPCPGREGTAAKVADQPIRGGTATDPGTDPDTLHRPDRPLGLANPRQPGRRGGSRPGCPPGDLFPPRRVPGGMPFLHMGLHHRPQSGVEEEFAGCAAGRDLPRGGRRAAGRRIVRSGIYLPETGIDGSVAEMDRLRANFPGGPDLSPALRRRDPSPGSQPAARIDQSIRGAGLSSGREEETSPEDQIVPESPGIFRQAWVFSPIR